MSFIQFVDEDRAQGDLAAVYDRIRRVRGGVADVMKLQSLNPPVEAQREAETAASRQSSPFAAKFST